MTTDDIEQITRVMVSVFETVIKPHVNATVDARLESWRRSSEGETFTDSQVIEAVRLFLDLGESTYRSARHQGYNFAQNGWAARVLRFHLERLGGAK